MVEPQLRPFAIPFSAFVDVVEDSETDDEAEMRKA